MSYMLKVKKEEEPKLFFLIRRYHNINTLTSAIKAIVEASTEYFIHTCT